MITQGDPCWVSEEASHVERERAQHRLFHLLRQVHVLHHHLRHLTMSIVIFLQFAGNLLSQVHTVKVFFEQKAAF